MTRLGLLVAELRPYHRARLAALPAEWNIVVFEDALTSAGVGTDAPVDPRMVRICADFGRVKQRDARRLVDAQALDFLLIPGWSSLSALVLMRVAAQLDVPVIILSDSAESDFRRGRLQEFLKGIYLAPVHAALVAGAKHQRYLSMLGFIEGRIRLGYDVVDNEHFSCNRGNVPDGVAAETVRAPEAGPYMLCCARLVGKKNLAVLLQGFARFLEVAEQDGQALENWRLLVAGDGPLLSQLVDHVASLGITDKVEFLGTVDYSALPDLYRNAQIFVLPSKTEQWGLVVNEAMASGLAVVVSDRVGCVGDLVVDGQNGLVFPHDDPDKLCECLYVLAANPLLRQELGSRAAESVGLWDCQRYANAVQELVKMQVRRPDRLLVWWYGIFLWLAILVYRIVQPSER